MHSCSNAVFIPMSTRHIAICCGLFQEIRCLGLLSKCHRSRESWQDCEMMREGWQNCEMVRESWQDREMLKERSIELQVNEHTGEVRKGPRGLSSAGSAGATASLYGGCSSPAHLVLLGGRMGHMRARAKSNMSSSRTTRGRNRVNPAKAACHERDF